MSATRRFPAGQRTGQTGAAPPGVAVIGTEGSPDRLPVRYNVPHPHGAGR